MTSKEALSLLIPKDIQTHIDFRNKYGSSIKGFICKDLDRLEKLEKTIEILKDRVKMFEIYHGPKSRYYYLYIGGRIVFLSREEYELLKEVLENEV